MKEYIRSILSQRNIQKIHASDNAIPAAVILPLYQKNGEWFVMFTKRTYSVETHKGQISFPGGMREEGDATLEYTARRETFEEIGIAIDDIEILGRLDDQMARSGIFNISPFVGIVPYPHTLNISHNEVAQVVEVPLKYLLSKGALREGLYPHQQGAFTVYFWQYKGQLIWGATAIILKRFLALVFPQGYLSTDVHL